MISSVENQQESIMTEDNKKDILRGTLDLLVLKILDTMGSIHGWGIARRIEQVTDQKVFLN
jgi:DNA-binding PadR family transcriptional regulator